MNASETAGKLKKLIGSIQEGIDSRFERVDLLVRRRGDRIRVSGLTTSQVAAHQIGTFLTAHKEIDIDLRFELAGGEGEDRILAEPSAPVIHFRQNPSSASQLLTQAIPGEILEVLSQRGDWVMLKGEDGYLGWVSRSGLHFPCNDPRTTSHSSVRVTALYAPLREAPEERAPILHRAPFDALLPLLTSRSEWLAVKLPSGGEGWISARETLLEESRPRYFEPDDLISTLHRMIGIPYLWGGCTPLGFDCSGLVQRLFRHHKIMLPRDSDLQARAVEPLSRNRNSSPGDLLFFGENRVDHVAISLGGRDFIHASGSVKVESLDSDSPLFRKDLKERWHGSGRVKNFGIRAESTDLFEA